MRLPGLALLALLSDPPVPGGFVEVAEGVRLRVQPSAASRALVVVDAAQELQVLEAKGGWVRVRYASYSGWLKPEGDDGELGPVERLPERDDERLQQAVNALPKKTREVRPRPFGPYILYTDVAAPGALALLERTAASLASIYSDRYGARPVESDTPDALVLFEKATGYATLAAGDERLARIGPKGHASTGFAVLALSLDGIDESRGLLTHELTHLLNRRALGGLLPAWLEEGLATDLAMCRFGPDGRPVPDSLRDRVRISRGTSRGSPVREFVWHKGPLASVQNLAGRARRGELLPPSALLPLRYETFITAGERRDDNYTTAALLIRFLLADGLPGSRNAFRGFLESVSRGESPSHERLLRSLGTEGRSLDERYRKWLVALPAD